MGLETCHVTNIYVRALRVTVCIISSGQKMALQLRTYRVIAAKQKQPQGCSSEGVSTLHVNSEVGVFVACLFTEDGAHSCLPLPRFCGRVPQSIFPSIFPP